MVQRNVLAMSGRAVEAAGDVDVLLLDKTGTITLGNRQATRFVPVTGEDEREVARAAMLVGLMVLASSLVIVACGILAQFVHHAAR
jgi:K+-transporting ATPase ATPase B chain